MHIELKTINPQQPDEKTKLITNSHPKEKTKLSNYVNVPEDCKRIIFKHCDDVSKLNFSAVNKENRGIYCSDPKNVIRIKVGETKKDLKIAQLNEKRVSIFLGLTGISVMASVILVVAGVLIGLTTGFSAAFFLPLLGILSVSAFLIGATIYGKKINAVCQRQRDTAEIIYKEYNKITVKEEKTASFDKISTASPVARKYLQAKGGDFSNLSTQ